MRCNWSENRNEYVKCLEGLWDSFDKWCFMKISQKVNRGDLKGQEVKGFQGLKIFDRPADISNLLNKNCFALALKSEKWELINWCLHNNFLPP